MLRGASAVAERLALNAVSVHEVTGGALDVEGYEVTRNGGVMQVEIRHGSMAVPGGALFVPMTGTTSNVELEYIRAE